MTIVKFPSHSLSRPQSVVAIRCHQQTPSDQIRIACALPFADAHHLWFIQAVKLLAYPFFLSLETLAQHQQPTPDSSGCGTWRRRSQDSPQPRLSCFSFLHALKLFRMHNDDHDGCLLQKLLGSSDAAERFDSSLHWPTSTKSCVIQFRIGWMRDVLFLNGRINIDLSQFLWRHLLVVHSDGGVSCSISDNLSAPTRFAISCLSVECNGT